MKKHLNITSVAVNFVLTDLQEAHTVAVSENPVLSILILDLIKKAAEIDLKLKEVLTVL